MNSVRLFERSGRTILLRNFFILAVLVFTGCLDPIGEFVPGDAGGDIDPSSDLVTDGSYQSVDATVDDADDLDGLDGARPLDTDANAHQEKDVLVGEDAEVESDVGRDADCSITNGGVESCDKKDNDCDGRIDEKVGCTFRTVFGSAQPDSVNDFVIDRKTGDIFLVGNSRGAVSGQSSAGKRDILVSRIGEAGKVKWVRLIGTSESEEGVAISLDHGSRRLFVGGTTRGSMGGVINNGILDGVILALTMNGKRLWTESIRTPSRDIVSAVSFSETKGVLYVAGESYGALHSQVNNGVGDVFVAQYDPTGNRQWTRMLGSKVTDLAVDLLRDSSGGIYLVGEALDDIGGVKLDCSSVFIAHYDGNASRKWLRPMQSAYQVEGADAMLDGQKKNIYVAGQISESKCSNTNGCRDLMLAKFSLASRSWQWTKKMNTAPSCMSGSEYAYSVTSQPNSGRPVMLAEGPAAAKKFISKQGFFLAELDASKKLVGKTIAGAGTKDKPRVLKTSAQNSFQFLLGVTKAQRPAQDVLLIRLR